MILDKITEATKNRIAGLKAQKSTATVRSEAEGLPPGKDFKGALTKKGFKIIAELKKASPSKGIIAADFSDIYLKKAKEYEDGGAAAISCLTEPEFFLGTDEYLRNIRETVNLPILRKDFTVDEYQIYEAKTIGADAVLLICSILSAGQLGEYLHLAKELSLAALVETHNENEMEMALAAGAEIIGVNNRNLQDFSMDVGNSLNLKKKMPEGKIFVAESGITSAAAVNELKAAGIEVALIGEALMRAGNAREMLKELRGELR
ncbi:MAG: indole-3-glycerol phosphate synthase TrpC [Phascolarctobacterium sp.]|nr:indole-3-glycerol phosphate synthase TrpC [Phascolarctobacterium sp.]